MLTMADYFTQFSATLPLPGEATVSRALAIFHEWAAEHPDGAELLGFAVRPQSCGLALHCEDAGNVEEVVNFVIHLHTALPRTGRWGFAWADTCSKPRLDGFGGGAVAIDFDQSPPTVEWVNTTSWLDEHTRPTSHD